MYALTKEDLIERLKEFPNTTKIYVGEQGHNGSVDWEATIPIIGVSKGVWSGHIILHEDESDTAQ